MKEINRERWDRLMQQWGFSDTEETYQQLLFAYSEKHRYYHTLQHLNDCFEKWEEVSLLAQDPKSVELALWFHDAIYQPYRKENELRSAQWMAHFLQEHSVQASSIETVHRLILATAHSTETRENDSTLLVDIDLSILGSAPEVYDDFEAAIRKEYQRVPSFLYRKKRGKLLRSFLEREQIFIHPHFFDKYEKQARSNVERYWKKR
jgi:predicted metal-dependent HD superfamily phosphohydrolase